MACVESRSSQYTNPSVSDQLEDVGFDNALQEELITLRFDLAHITQRHSRRQHLEQQPRIIPAQLRRRYRRQARLFVAP